MKEYTAVFRSVKEISTFVSIANRQPFPVQILEGDNTFDAKSILGLFDVHLNTLLTIRIDDRYADPQPFIAAIQPYIDAARHLD
ncbi:MAG: hypothetical protein MRZ24_06600 [Clostridiales bacterium]|nr:hypothetical protein [Clostridiales bacterium]